MIIHMIRTSLLALLFLTAIGHAQLFLGTGASFISDAEYGGLNIRGQFDLFNTGDGKTTVCPNISQYRLNTDVSRFEMNLDFHNMLGEPKPFMGYLIAGLRYDLDVTGISSQTTTSEGDLGLNIGMGIQYTFIENLKFYIEGKYLGGREFNGFLIGTGIAAAFGKRKK
ncbi:MAG: hypothetical protein AB8F95_19020 [Bacteroidia bacterium]